MMFSPENPIRRFCWGLAHWSVFQWFLLFAILASCVFLAMDRPTLADDDPIKLAIQVCLLF